VELIINKNIDIQKIKRISAVVAIIFGVAFTFSALFTIWGIAPFTFPDSENGVSNKMVLSLAILTAAFFVLVLILRALEEKN
jgi:hypothetical protein